MPAHLVLRGPDPLTRSRRAGRTTGKRKGAQKPAVGLHPARGPRHAVRPRLPRCNATAAGAGLTCASVLDRPMRTVSQVRPQAQGDVRARRAHEHHPLGGHQDPKCFSEFAHPTGSAQLLCPLLSQPEPTKASALGGDTGSGRTGSRCGRLAAVGRFSGIQEHWRLCGPRAPISASPHARRPQLL